MSKLEVGVLCAIQNTTASLFNTSSIVVIPEIGLIRRVISGIADNNRPPYLTGVGLDPVCDLAAMKACQKEICHG